MNKDKLPLICFLVIAAILRFYNLMHDAPHFFDPDERNMAGAVTQLRLPSRLSEIPSCLSFEFIAPFFRTTTSNQKPIADDQKPETENCSLNPRFFAYGQFPLYLAFASDQLIKPFSNLAMKPLSDPQTTTNMLPLSTSFPSAIFWLRFYSALSSTLTVLLVYLITKQLLSIESLKLSRRLRDPAEAGKISNLAALSAAFTPGLIQAAHFGTTESLLTFFFLSSIYFSLRLIDIPRLPFRKFLFHNFKFTILLSFSIGLALGSKFTGLFFLVPPATAIVIGIIRILIKRKKKFFINLLGYWVIGLLVLIGSILIGILSSPYNLVEPQNFRSAVFGYEADVAIGKYEAFYTRQFVDTVPFLFQIEKIFPYALGWPAFILGSIGFLFMHLKLILWLIIFIGRKIQSSKLPSTSLRAGKAQIRKFKFYLDFKSLEFIWILIFGFWIYFIPNAFLFAKWTRFMTPLFPFFAIFTGYFIFKLFHFICHSDQARYERVEESFGNIKIVLIPKIPRLRFAPLGMTKLIYWVIGLLVLITPGLAFMSIYTHEDSRVTSSRWIHANIPDNSYILSETANVVDIPLGFPANLTDKEGKALKQLNNAIVVSYDFYHLDENPILFEQLIDHLEKSSYIFMPSRRLFKNFPRLPRRYPIVTKYYQLLFSGTLGFEKVAQFSSFPRIGSWQFPDEDAEETFTVFDHPVIRIYKKSKILSAADYRKLLESPLVSK